MRIRSRLVRLGPLALVALSTPCLAESASTPADLAAASADFACALYRTLEISEPGNLFFSPHSISSALAMTYAGARGETASQMARTLGFDRIDPSVHPLFAQLDRELAQRAAADPEERGGDPFRLRVANALWGEAGYEFLPEFLGVLSENYGAGLSRLDFSGDPEASRRTINEQIAKDTEDKIRELLKEGDITAATRLVLTNAIYFKASWSEPFSENRTKDASFHLLDGSAIETPFMEKSDHFPYHEEEGLQAIEIPYVGDQVAFLVILPAEGRFEVFETDFTAERLRSITSGLHHQMVDLRLPRFETRSRFSLNDALSRMGMPAAFNYPGADFSGMNGNRELFIGGVIHESFVKVDEKGTEAAAATAVIMKAGGMPPRPISLAIDRPFLFLVRDRTTGAVLFLGRLLDPR